MSPASASGVAAAIGFSLLDERVRRDLERAEPSHRAARAVGAAARLRLRGVALGVVDALEQHAGEFVHELADAGALPLPMRMHATEHHDVAARGETDIHAVVEDAAELDVVADQQPRSLPSVSEALQISSLFHWMISTHAVEQPAPDSAGVRTRGVSASRMETGGRVGLRRQLPATSVPICFAACSYIRSVTTAPTTARRHDQQLRRAAVGEGAAPERCTWLRHRGRR